MTPNNGFSWGGGFVTFPNATYEYDSKSELQPDGNGNLQTSAEPVLLAYDEATPFYDLAMKRWLPASPAQTAPDGRTYAYATPPAGSTPGRVVVVTVATGAARAVTITAPGNPTLEDFDGRYAYLSDVEYAQDRGIRGVWRVDTATGSIVRLSQAGSVVMVRYPELWVGSVDPADASPPATPIGSHRPFDTISEVNLMSGVETRWIYRPTQSVALLGLDDTGQPVVNVGGDIVFVLTTPGGVGTQISDGPRVVRIQIDGARIWLGSPGEIYLWTPAGGLQDMFPFSPTQPIVPAGRCV